jgi:hypothetical protein
VISKTDRRHDGPPAAAVHAAGGAGLRSAALSTVEPGVEPCAPRAPASHLPSTRLALAILTVLILLTMVFLPMRVAPGNPIQAALGGHVPQAEIER